MWAKIYRFQPSAKMVSWGPVNRLVMDWYYIRIPIRIVPTRILWWPKGDFNLPACHLEEGYVGQN